MCSIITLLFTFDYQGRVKTSQAYGLPKDEIALTEKVKTLSKGAPCKLKPLIQLLII